MAEFWVAYMRTLTYPEPITIIISNIDKSVEVTVNRLTEIEEQGDHWRK